MKFDYPEPKSPASRQDASSSSGEAESLKTKQQNKRSQNLHRLSWCTVATMEKMGIHLISTMPSKDLKSKSFRRMLKPLSFTEEQIFTPLSQFCSSIVEYVPRVQDDKTGQRFESACSILSSPNCIRLFGLLSHFCYWNVVFPCVSHINEILEARRAGTALAPVLSTNKQVETHGDEGEIGRDDDDDDDDDELHLQYRNAIANLTTRLQLQRHGSDQQQTEKFLIAVDEDLVVPVEVASDPSILHFEEDGSHRDNVDATVSGGDSFFSSEGKISLSEAEKEMLFVQVEECLFTIHKSVSPFAPRPHFYYK